MNRARHTPPAGQHAQAPRVVYDTLPLQLPRHACEGASGFDHHDGVFHQGTGTVRPVRQNEQPRTQGDDRCDPTECQSRPCDGRPFPDRSEHASDSNRPRRLQDGAPLDSVSGQALRSACSEAPPAGGAWTHTPYTRVKTSEPLVPPKPKELVNAASIRISRASCGM